MDMRDDIDYKYIEWGFLRDKLGETLNLLPDRERTIIVERFFFKSTFEEIAKKYKVVKQTINFIEKRALRRLRSPNNILKLEGFKYLISNPSKKISAPSVIEEENKNPLFLQCENLREEIQSNKEKRKLLKEEIKTNKNKNKDRKIIHKINVLSLRKQYKNNLSKLSLDPYHSARQKQWEGRLEEERKYQGELFKKEQASLHEGFRRWYIQNFGREIHEPLPKGSSTTQESQTHSQSQEAPQPQL